MVLINYFRWLLLVLFVVILLTYLCFEKTSSFEGTLLRYNPRKPISELKFCNLNLVTRVWIVDRLHQSLLCHQIPIILGNLLSKTPSFSIILSLRVEPLHYSCENCNVFANDIYENVIICDQTIRSILLIAKKLKNFIDVDF